MDSKTAIVSRRNNCRLCGGTDLELALPLTPAPIVDAYVPAEKLDVVQESFPLDLYLCQCCGHAQLLDVVDPEVLYGEYIYVTNSSLGLVEHFDQYAEDVLSQIKPLPGSLVVDIGSNDGTLLQAFQKRGMQVLGIDPAVEIAENATKAGIETKPVFFSFEESKRIREEHGTASIITVNNLFANVDDLGDLANGIANLLSPDGVFLFESYYVLDLARNMVFDFIYHEHLNSFSAKPLDAFFKRYGMELIDVQGVSTKGGSLRGTVQLSGADRGVSPSVADFIRKEEDAAVHSLGFFQEFGAVINEKKDRLVEFLDEAKSQGKSVAGYGASASTTPLVYHFGIGDRLTFMADDNPAKQHLYSPGLHIPVLPSDSLYEKKPDYVVILAWRYADAIIEKHQSYLDQGGHFIIPLPTLTVV